MKENEEAVPILGDIQMMTMSLKSYWWGIKRNDLSEGFQMTVDFLTSSVYFEL